MRAEQFYNKNQLVIFDNEKTTFQSYDSVVATIDKEVLTLGYNWNYGSTTRKHLYMFIREFAPSIWQQIESTKANAYNEAIQKLIDNKTIKYNKNL